MRYQDCGIVRKDYFGSRQRPCPLNGPGQGVIDERWKEDAGRCEAAVDLFQYQTGQKVVKANGLQGPRHPELGIAMDMSIQMQTEEGALLTLSLSFNNNGPLGTIFRYICDEGTFIASYDDLVDGKRNPIDVSQVAVSMNGIELQDREFFAAINEGREPNSSVGKVLECYRTLHQIEQQL